MDGIMLNARVFTCWVLTQAFPEMVNRVEAVGKL